MNNEKKKNCTKDTSSPTNHDNDSTTTSSHRHHFSALKTSSSSSSSVTQIQATSLLTSYWRYKESQRPIKERLIEDLPDGILLNALLTSEQRQLFEDSPVLNRGIDALALRTRFIDDWLLQRFPDTSVNQTNSKNNVIVNLGAGMDARPYRLTELATRTKYIEVDSDRSLLEMKHSILQGRDDTYTNGHLQPYCPVTRVETDLSDPKATLNALKDAGLQLSSYEEEIGNNNNDNSQMKESIDFIAEGLFAYLQPSQHQPLLKLCHDVSGPNSRLILTCLDPSGIDNFQSMGSFQIPWKKLVPYQNIVAQAQDVGWQHSQVLPMKDLFDLYQRRPVTSLDGYFILTLAK